eukprot:7902457-Pyramimonas_sp.AAC.1
MVRCCQRAETLRPWRQAASRLLWIYVWRHPCSRKKHLRFRDFAPQDFLDIASGCGPMVFTAALAGPNSRQKHQVRGRVRAGDFFTGVQAASPLLSVLDGP